MTRRQDKKPSKRRTTKPPATPPATGPTAILLSDGLFVDCARTVVAGDGVAVNEERNVEPSEVTSEFVVTTVGGGVVTTGINVVVDDDESVGVSEGGNEGVNVGVGVGVVNEGDGENGVEEQADPKKVINTVTGTSTVCVAGTKTVVVSPGKVINEDVIVG